MITAVLSAQDAEETILVVPCKGIDHFFRIDTEDVERVLAVGHWNVTTGRKPYLSHNEYVKTGVRKRKGQKLLHRFLLNAPTGLHVDHINRDSYDNRKSNLRIVTARQNLLNRVRPTVHRHGDGWTAQLASKGRVYRLGLYGTEAEAAAAYYGACLAIDGLIEQERRSV